MSQAQTARQGPPMEALHEVRATFDSPEAMQTAIDQLSRSGFDRADLALPEPHPTYAEATPEAGAKPADTEEDARQARTMHTSTAASIGALAAAGAVIATGGAAAPAVAAAVLGGGLVGGAVFGISSAANMGEQADRDRKAAAGELLLSVHTRDATKRGEAEAILRGAGASLVEVM